MVGPASSQVKVKLGGRRMAASAGSIAAMAMSVSIAPPEPHADPPPAATSDAAASASPSRPLTRRGLERLDLLLLCAEALDYSGGESLVWICAQLGYDHLFPNRVELWKRRCHNPLRRSFRRGTLAVAETDALIRILGVMAERLYPMLHQLLSSSEPEPLSQQRWELFTTRLGELVRERMNPRRSGVQRLLDPRAGAPQRRQLIQTLALAAGPGGFERLRASLMDADG
jgi:hypothetical protein